MLSFTVDGVRQRWLENVVGSEKNLPGAVENRSCVLSGKPAQPAFRLRRSSQRHAGSLRWPHKSITRVHSVRELRIPPRRMTSLQAKYIHRTVRPHTSHTVSALHSPTHQLGPGHSLDPASSGVCGATRNSARTLLIRLRRGSCQWSSSRANVRYAHFAHCIRHLMPRYAGITFFFGGAVFFFGADACRGDFANSRARPAKPPFPFSPRNSRSFDDEIPCLHALRSASAHLPWPIF
jgi:hypothetical protein